MMRVSRSVMRRPRQATEHLPAVDANEPYHKALEPPAATARGRRHERIERAVVGEVAGEIRGLSLTASRLLQVQAGNGQQTLLFRDQLIRPQRPVIYDQDDGRDPEVRAATDFAAVDCEAAEFPALDDHFDLVVWNATWSLSRTPFRPYGRPGGSPGQAGC